MKNQILNLGKVLNKAALKNIKGNGPFSQPCMTDDDCPFCHTCENVFSGKVCIGNC